MSRNYGLTFYKEERVVEVIVRKWEEQEPQTYALQIGSVEVVVRKWDKQELQTYVLRRGGHREGGQQMR